MKLLGISQAELARRVGAAQPTIFKLIHDNKTGSKILHLVARELKTTAAYLTGETDDPDSEVPDIALDSEGLRWVELIRALPDRDRGAVLQLVRTIAEKQADHCEPLDFRRDGTTG